MARPSLRAAIVAYQGVLADESWAFRDVLSKIPGARVLTVGAAIGTVAGPGGAQQVVATFDDVTSRRRRGRARRARQPPPPGDLGVDPTSRRRGGC